MQQAIQDGLNDVDPYVKKTAIIGCIKFYHMSKKDFKSKQQHYLILLSNY